jgi:hypothetical protein
MILPAEARPVLGALAPAFTRPTSHRFVTLFGSAVLTTGRRTAANIRRTAAPIARGPVATYQRVLSCAEWSPLYPACQLCRLILALVPADQTVILAGDDTVDGHPGRKVYGKTRHRDPVRSRHGYTAWRYGPKWVALAVPVRFPWALPVLVGLDRSEGEVRKRRRPHRAPARIMTTPLRFVPLWFPDRKFAFVGGSGYGTRERARFVHRHRARLSLVSKPHPEANPFEPPPPYPGKGRPPAKGARRPKPKEAVAAATLQAGAVAWYGGGVRRAGVTGGTGHWYKCGEKLVPLVWGFVRDQGGTHRDEYFFSTDPEMTAVAMIAACRGRRNPETTFQEMRCPLGPQSTRGWCRRTVVRAAPCLFGS